MILDNVVVVVVVIGNNVDLNNLLIFKVFLNLNFIITVK